MNIFKNNVRTLDNTNNERSRNIMRSNQSIKISNKREDNSRNSNNKLKDEDTEEYENSNTLGNKENNLSSAHNEQVEEEGEGEAITANYIKFIWKQNLEMGKNNYR